MILKQQIQQGETFLKEYTDILDRIDFLINNKDDKKALEFLLEMQKLEFEGRANSVKQRLGKLKNDYILQFEKDSSESNFKMQVIINDAKSWVGHEPKGITDKLQPLIDSYEMYMDQEKKNNIYFELKAHLEFLNLKVKKK